MVALRKLSLALLLGAAPAAAAGVELSIHPPAAGAVATPAMGVMRPTPNLRVQRAAPKLPEVPAAHPATPEAVAAPQPAKKAAMVDMLAAQSKPAAVSPPSGEAMVTELHQELDEVRAHRSNIAELQQALTADVALLRESSALQRASATQHSRTAAKLQVRKTEALVKDLSSMLRDSRADAVEDAKTMMQQAAEVRSAADALAAEATSQIHLLSSKAVDHPAAGRPRAHHRHASAAAVPADDAAKAVVEAAPPAAVAPSVAVVEAPVLSAEPALPVVEAFSAKAAALSAEPVLPVVAAIGAKAAAPSKEPELPAVAAFSAKAAALSAEPALPVVAAARSPTAVVQASTGAPAILAAKNGTATDPDLADADTDDDA